MRRCAVVAGGAGFLGSHICERLLLEDYEVVCIDNLVTGSADNVAHLSQIGPFRLVRGDVTEPFDVPGNIDVVFHFASPASPVDYLRLPVETLKAGSLGTLHTLDLAKDKRARYVLASTSEVYGDPQIHPQPESYWGHVNPVGPRSVYDEAKRFGEALAVAYRNTHGVDTAIVRIFNTYGPRMRADDGRAIPTFIKQALSRHPITVSGTGSQTRSVCYVSDLVEGVMRLMDSGHAGPVNIGNPHELSVLQIAELVRRSCGSDSPIQFVPRPTDDPEKRKPDIAMAGELLGWAPKVPVEDGLKSTVAWFAESVELEQPVGRRAEEDR